MLVFRPKLIASVAVIEDVVTLISRKAQKVQLDAFVKAIVIWLPGALEYKSTHDDNDGVPPVQFNVVTAHVLLLELDISLGLPMLSVVIFVVPELEPSVPLPVAWSGLNVMTLYVIPVGPKFAIW